ncbi:Rv0361 family membrane protein [Mycolicibacterium sp. A43C]
MSNPTEPGDPNTEPTADASEAEDSSERRFTAPSGFDGSTQIIQSVPEPPTEIFAAGAPTEMIDTSKVAAPQVIPPREDVPKASTRRRSWGWVIAVVLVIAAVAAVAILGTVLLTRGSDGAASQEDQVRSTIENFDVAIQKGDLAALRGLTCGATRDSYVRYDDKAWTDTHRRVAAAKQYPVVASIDEVVVVNDHAEANVTTFMANAPQTRSTRSFDLQFRDDQWKICQNG